MGAGSIRITKLGRRLAGARGESGAAAVEFAILTVVLFPILFGILDYGLWFNDSLNARAAVREIARQGIVGDWSSGSCSDTGAEGLKCLAHERLVTITGDAFVSVQAEGWEQGDTLTVCAVVAADGVTGLIPMPDFISSHVDMAVERIPSADQSANESASDSLPDGATWSGSCAGSG